MKTIFYLLPKLAINITCAYTMYKSQDYWKMSKHICKSILIIIKIYIIYKGYKSKTLCKSLIIFCSYHQYLKEQPHEQWEEVLQAGCTS